MTHPDKPAGFLPCRECPTGGPAIATSAGDLAPLERISPRRRENERNLPAGRQEFRNRKLLERFSGTTWGWRPWLFLLLAVLCLAAVSAAAQTTVVSGAITDANGTPYSNGTISATLSPPGVSTPHIGAWQIQAGYGPFQIDSKGNFAMALPDNNQILPAGTQWKFTVNNPGVPPPLGTGPQTCSATVTITGASQVISSSFSCPALASISSATALKPATADALQFVTAEGSDSNDGKSWGTAKATLAAANTALTSGGVIQVACGTYTISASFSPSADVRIVGPSQKCAHLVAAASFSSALINISSVDRVSVSHMWLDCNNSALGVSGVSVSSSDSTVIADDWVDSCTYGVRLQASVTNATVQNNFFNSSNTYGIFAAPPNNSHDWHVRKNILLGNSASTLQTTGDGIDIDCGSCTAGQEIYDVDILDNFVTNYQTTGTEGIAISCTRVIRGCKIIGNTATNSYEGVGAGDDENGTIISNNFAYNNKRGGINVNSQSVAGRAEPRNITMTGNVAIANGSNQTVHGNYGGIGCIGSGACVGFTIAGNTATGNSADGIDVGSLTGTFTGNYASGNNTLALANGADYFFSTPTAETILPENNAAPATPPAGMVKLWVGSNAGLVIAAPGGTNYQPVTTTASLTVGNCLKWLSNGPMQVADAGGVCGLVLTGSVAGSITALAANSCGDAVTATVTGATTSMVATASPQAALSAGLVLSTPFVSAANTVTVGYCNVTTASITPAAATFNIRVIQ